MDELYIAWQLKDQQTTEGTIISTVNSPQPTNGTEDTDRACNHTHGTVGGLLALIPAPAPGKAKGDPFVTLSGRAAKAWLALFAHARTHGDLRPRPVDPSRPELIDDQQYTLASRWTVAGLGHAMGVNRDTAGKALHELVEGGWVRREDPRKTGQFGGIDYVLVMPTTVTQADCSATITLSLQRQLEFPSKKLRRAPPLLRS
jgi:hypothetical protein